MYYHIRHKETREVRYGTWDSEYLNFKTHGGDVTWRQYKNWEPIGDIEHTPEVDPLEHSKQLQKEYFETKFKTNAKDNY